MVLLRPPSALHLPCHQGPEQRGLESGGQRASALGPVQTHLEARPPVFQGQRSTPLGAQKQIHARENRCLIPGALLVRQTSSEDERTQTADVDDSGPASVAQT